jgi:Zn finger protein HypA/HybF involved in hydrogenase expression
MKYERCTQCDKRFPAEKIDMNGNCEACEKELSKRDRQEAKVRRAEMKGKKK